MQNEIMSLMQEENVFLPVLGLNQDWTSLSELIAANNNWNLGIYIYLSCVFGLLKTVKNAENVSWISLKKAKPFVIHIRNYLLFLLIYPLKSALPKTNVIKKVQFWSLRSFEFPVV